MDRDHRLDAPNNDELSTIDQIGDRSGLSATYHHAQDEWKDIALMSGEARAKKQAEEQIRINLSIRKWFPIIGLLIPIPAVIFSVLIAFGAENLDMKQAGILLLPVFFAITMSAYISYKAIRAVYAIFYNHSIKATPYLIAHVTLLVISFQGLFKLSQQYHTGWAVGDSLIASGFVLAVSVILSGILVFVWTSRKLPSGVKFGIIAALAVIIAGIQLYYTLV